MRKLFTVLHIEYPDIAWQTASIMLHVFGLAALLAYLVTLRWFLIPGIVLLGITFYAGYYFNLNYRTRRFERMEY